MSQRLTIVRPGLPVPPATAGDRTLSFDEFRRWLSSGEALVHVGRHQEGRMLVQRLESAGRPLPLALALRALCRGAIYVEDVRGRRRALTVGQILGWMAQLATEPFRAPALLHNVEREVAVLEAAPVSRPPAVDFTRSALYLRTDLSFSIRAGGSVGHIAGVVNELGSFTGQPIFLTTDDVPTVRSDIETHHIVPSEEFWNFRELPTFVLNGAVDATASKAIGPRDLAFVYQRYSLNNYAGLRIARARRVPLVLEYNGSEIWMSRHWGRPIKYEPLADRIEALNLARADLVVVVSRAMEKELVERGVDPGRILVNFNGVDEHRYRPDVDGGPIRERYGLRDKLVIGFIGTFGPWHGADVLARAFVSWLSQDPSRVQSTRLLMIGDGAGVPAVKRIVAEGDSGESVVFTGLVPQEEGPAYLAACDVLVSPHVRNPDGTPFFGSPTKLFEYMAMGKGIVASQLDQIGEVLKHGRDAWLVEPGDVEQLVDGIRQLAENAESRARLGAQARREVLERHTWRQHTRRTIERLQTISV